MHAIAFDLINIGCWLGCFWWMHRISTRQDSLLEQLQQQTKELEEVAKEEHAILAELHPNVQSLKDDVSEVAQKVGRVERTVDQQSSN